MKKLIFVLIMCLTLISCSFVQTSSVCETAPEDSLICQYIPNPESADILMQLAAYELLKANPQAKEAVSEILDHAFSNLDQEVLIWSDIVMWVVAQSDYLKANFGGEIVILSGYATVLNYSVPISNFDKNLLKIHIERLKKVVAMI